MRKRLLQALRHTNTLGAANQLNGLRHRLISWPGNRRFRANNPDFPVPPVDLAFEAYGHCCWEEYKSGGEAHARLISDLIHRYAQDPQSQVAEWGCGCARILRNMPAAGIEVNRLTGIDIDGKAIDWSREHIAGVRFSRCRSAPPIDMPDACFGAIYHYSVWTHLSPQSVRAWSAELARMLQPGGVMIGTAHGDRYRSMLLPHESAIYQSGRPVVREQFQEGRKFYLSFLPPVYLRTLLSEYFCHVEAIPTGRDVPQDVWVAIKA